MKRSSFFPLLPGRLRELLLKYADITVYELRLRVGRPASLSTDRGNLLLPFVMQEEEMKALVEALCHGSLHAYSDTMREGYLPLPDGCRVGVCGLFSCKELTEVSSLCFRLPRTIRGIGASLCRTLLNDKPTGMLLFSPPGEGKTTLLRDMAATLSSPPYCKRVAVIDSRRELYRADAFAQSLADVYLGCQKGVGIELAVRTMSPEYLFCDELGSSEAESILLTQNVGVPLVASAHAPSLEALLRRPTMKRLYLAGVFGYYVGIKREGRGFFFDITENRGDAL